MCLIAGGMEENLREKLIKMALAGKHRGPNGFGVWTDEGTLKSDDFSRVNEIPAGKIGLLHCRLAITGSKDFTQPFLGELVLVHNGEVYNHRTLRDYLEGKGVPFESDVDSEVILRLIEFLREKGLGYTGIVKKLFLMLEGDYAVAFSDGRRIYLLRDPIGIRPLYLSRNGLFASEKKILWAVGEREVEPLKPGELAVIDESGVRRARLFSIENLRGSFTPRNPVDGLEKLLGYAVRNRSLKRTGVLFSGGLDSTLIAYLSSLHSEVVLYTAGAEDSPDLEWARRVADHFGWKLREEVFNIEDVREAVKDVMWAIEEPNPMNLAIGIPLYFASKRASSDGIRVLLSGQGADELFGGYAKYVERPELMEKDLLEIGERNLARDDKVTMLNRVEGRYPFLALPVVSLALKLPLEEKIANGRRKLILRKLALKLGIPEWIAMREKKAAQYGSKAQKLLEKIAKGEGLRLREFAERLYGTLFSPPSKDLP